MKKNNANNKILENPSNLQTVNGNKFKDRTNTSYSAKYITHT